jgi:ankyrin repeat protein
MLLIKSLESVPIIKLINTRGIYLEYKPYPPINFAIRFSTLDVVLYMVELNVDLYQLDRHKKMAIHRAIDRVDFGIFYAIILRIDPHKLSSRKENLLHYYGSFLKNYNTTDALSVLKYLLNLGINIEQENDYGLRPIHYACKIGDLTMVKLLIEYGASTNCSTIHKWKPIPYAVRPGNSGVVEYLVSLKVGIECKTDNGMKPIYMKISDAILSYLVVECGADTSAISMNKYMDGHYTFRIADPYFQLYCKLDCNSDTQRLYKYISYKPVPGSCQII